MEHSDTQCEDCELPATKDLLGHAFCEDHYWTARMRLQGKVAR